MSGDERALPVRRPPSCAWHAGTASARKTCEICGQDYLVMPPSRAGYYRTCSRACNLALRSRVRCGRPWSVAARAADRRQKRFR